MFIVGIQEGQAVQIGDRVIRAQEVIQPGLVRFTIDGEDLPVTISWDRKLTIFPDVMVTIDRSSACYSKRIRLLFDAPRHVRIRELPYEDGE